MQKAIEALGSQMLLAQEIGVSQGTIWDYKVGRRKVPAKRALQIESATNGVVKRWELRPDLWEPPPEKN